MSDDVKVELVGLIAGIIILAAISFLGYCLGENGVRKEAAKAGVGRFTVDPVKGGDIKFEWISTNRLDKSQ